MTKSKQSTKKKKSNVDRTKDKATKSNTKPVVKKQADQKSGKNIRKKTDKKGAGETSVLGYIDTARQFLRESKIELKKVKWPSRKELLASTAVVIFISLAMAFYFWIVDLGLTAIIKRVLV